MREHLIAPVLEWKAAGASGELEGYASVFGNLDQGGDVAPVAQSLFEQPE